MYKRADELANGPLTDNEIVGFSGVGSNPATEVGQVTIEHILSKKHNSQWARVGGRGGDLESPFLARI